MMHARIARKYPQSSEECTLRIFTSRQKTAEKSTLRRFGMYAVPGTRARAYARTPLPNSGWRPWRHFDAMSGRTASPRYGLTPARAGGLLTRERNASVIDPHADHDIRTAVTVGQGDRWGFLVCSTCRVVVQDLPLCPEVAKNGQPCRWAISPAEPERAQHPHTEPKPTAPQPPTKRQVAPDLAWFVGLFTQHGQIDGDAITITDIKRGQATWLQERHGGSSVGQGRSGWSWRCDGEQAIPLIAAIGTDGRGE